MKTEILLKSDNIGEDKAIIVNAKIWGEGADLSVLLLEAMVKVPNFDRVVKKAARLFNKYKKEFDGARTDVGGKVFDA